MLCLVSIKSRNSSEHVDGECNDDVEADDDRNVVKRDKEEPSRIWGLNINKNLRNFVPVIHNHQCKKRHEAISQIVEIVQEIVVRIRRVRRNRTRVPSHPPAEPVHADQAEKVENGELDQKERVEGAQQIFDGFNDNSERLDFVQHREDSEQPNEDYQLEKTDRIVEFEIVERWNDK